MQKITTIKSTQNELHCVLFILEKDLRQREPVLDRRPDKHQYGRNTNRVLKYNKLNSLTNQQTANVNDTSHCSKERKSTEAHSSKMHTRQMQNSSKQGMEQWE